MNDFLVEFLAMVGLLLNGVAFIYCCYEVRNYLFGDEEE